MMDTAEGETRSTTWSPESAGGVVCAIAEDKVMIKKAAAANILAELILTSLELEGLPWDDPHSAPPQKMAQRGKAEWPAHTQTPKIPVTLLSAWMPHPFTRNRQT